MGGSSVAGEREVKLGRQVAATRNHDDGEVSMRLVKNEDQFQSLGVRHDDVGDDEIDGRFLEPLKRVFAIGGFYHGMTFVLPERGGEPDACRRRRQPGVFGQYPWLGTFLV